LFAVKIFIPIKSISLALTEAELLCKGLVCFSLGKERPEEAFGLRKTRASIRVECRAGTASNQ
jgi:hypothetical protein